MNGNFQAIKSAMDAYARENKWQIVKDCLLDRGYHNQGDLEALHYLGCSYFFLGEYPESINCFESVIKATPDAATANFYLGLSYGFIGNRDLSLNHLKSATALDKDNIDYRLKLGTAYQLNGELFNARKEYRICLELNPQHGEANLRYADLMLSMGEADRARQHYQRVSKSNDANLHSAVIGMARLELYSSNYTKAYNLIRPILETAAGADNHAAAIIYAEICQHCGDPNEALQRLEGITASQQIPDEARITAYFAKGKLLDKLGAYDAAFDAYARGNTAAHVTYNPWEEAEKYNNYIKFWDSRLLAGLPESKKQNKAFKPIFIVGMPRSGTTLLEGILGNHSQVEGLGELGELTSIVQDMPTILGTTLPYPYFLTQLRQSHVDALSKRYLKYARSRMTGDARYFVDKMPHNFTYLGLIGKLFPNAKIIHMMRHPLDTCLSCYFQHFSSIHIYSYNLEHLGMYYKQYKKLMAHWKNVLDLEILDVDYEKVVLYPQEQVARVLEFCELPWEKKCVEPRSSKKLILTSSFSQADQPLYDKSVNRYHNYAAHLTPLIKALDKDY